MSCIEEPRDDEEAATRGDDEKGRPGDVSPSLDSSMQASGMFGATPWRGAARAGVGAVLAGFVTACSGPGAGPGPVPQPQEPVNPSSLGVPGDPELGTKPTSPALAREPLPPPKTMRSMAQVRVQAAQRMVQANAGQTYLGAPPEVLLAIPVLEVELNADGSVRRVSVMRKPGQAQDTTQLAINAVYRAAPYGDVSRLPKPWKFVETFLFDDDRRFKPRTLQD